jgi:broad specificity phosphatase PhoE
MPRPVIYYVRHGLTDWNAAGRLQGQRDIPLNATGRGEAVHCGDILRDLFARDGCAPEAFDYVSSPLTRASETMDIVRTTLGLPGSGYRTDARLAEIAFGAWEGWTYDEVLARDPDIVARREADKWGFLPPGGENYAQLAERVGAWYATVAHDTVVTAHGGTARALVAVTGVAPPEAAVHYSIDQGVVYVFAAGGIGRYG